MQFEEIYVRYYKEVYYYLLALDGNRETAEELTQETFFRAMKAIHKFKGGCQLGTWLCQIAKHTYFSWKKKYRREIVSESPEEMELDRERHSKKNPWKFIGYFIVWRNRIRKFLLYVYWENYHIVRLARCLDGKKIGQE